MLRPRGYALVFALIIVAAVSLAAAIAAQRAQHEAQRERELQLLWVGNQYRQALFQFSNVSVNGISQYPRALEELLDDERTPVPRRHLRQLYVDPFTGKVDWVLEINGDRIVGLHSRSTLGPIRHAGLGPGNESFANARSYAEWRFMGASAPAANSIAAVAVNASSAGAPGSDGLAPQATGDGSNSDSSQAPDPNFAARQNCYTLYMNPRSECTSASPPMGDSLTSCMKAFAQAYAACMAGIGG